MTPDGHGTIEDRLFRVEELLRRMLSFGDPQNPLDATDTTAAGSTSTAHNGRLENTFGAWAEVTFDHTDTPEVVVYHNLGTPVVNSELNVRWLIFGVTHDGTLAAGTSVISVIHEIGDTLTTTSIGLRCYAEATRTIDADHPVKATLLFIPAVRGIH